MEETETQAAQPASICPDVEATGDDEIIDLENDGQNDTRQHAINKHKMLNLILYQWK